MKLYEIPEGSIIKDKDVDIKFWHIDGAYSYCTIGDDVVHLAAWTPLTKVDNHYVIDYEK